MKLLYRAAPGVRSVVTADGGVLLDLNRGVCYSLNPVGSRIWSALSAGKQGLTFESVVEDLMRQYTMPRPRLERDVAAFLSALKQKQLVKAIAHNRD